MRRRLLELCLLAYPRACRGQDREYLRDLALELTERQGFARQAASLLAGGVRQRIRDIRTARARVGAVALAALALAFGGVAVSAAAHGEHSVDRFSCVTSARGADGGCAAPARKLLASRARAGWQCSSHSNLLDPLRTSLQCVRNP